MLSSGLTVLGWSRSSPKEEENEKSALLSNHGAEFGVAGWSLCQPSGCVRG